MKKQLFPIALILSLLCVNCNENVIVKNEKYGLRFNNEYTIGHSEPVSELFIVGAINVVDTLLLVQPIHENPLSHIDIYNLNNMKHCGSVLKNGRGANEVLSVSYLGQYEKINNEIWIYFSDLNTGRLLKLNLTQSLKTGRDKIELISKIDINKHPYFVVDTNSFIYRNYDYQDESLNLVIGDNSWDNYKIKKCIKQDVNQEDYYQKLSQSTYFYNNKNKKACWVCGFLDQIRIVDIYGNDDVVLSTAKLDNWPLIRQQDFSELKLFYTSTKVFDNYIFALYSNKKISDWESQKEVEIHVFNWDGVAIAKMKFEDNITSFAVDIDNMILYGLDNAAERLFAYSISYIQ